MDTSTSTCTNNTQIETAWFGYHDLTPDQVMDIMNHFRGHPKVLEAYERLTLTSANALEVVRSLEATIPLPRVPSTTRRTGSPMQGLLPLRRRSGGAPEPYDRSARNYNEGSPRARSREPRRLAPLAQADHVGNEKGALLHRGFSPQQCLPHHNMKRIKDEISPPPGLSPIAENLTSPGPPSSEVTSDKGGPDSPSSPHNTEAPAATISPSISHQATHHPPWNEDTPMMQITPSASPRSAPKHRFNRKRPQTEEFNDDTSRGK